MLVGNELNWFSSRK